MATVSISKEPRTQRLPLRMKVGDLKRLCSRFFKVPPSQQRLKYREADDFFCSSKSLDDDWHYVLRCADGGTVFIHDDGDRNKYYFSLFRSYDEFYINIYVVCASSTSLIRKFLRRDSTNPHWSP